MKIYLGRLYVCTKHRSPIESRFYNNWHDADIWLDSEDWYCIKIKYNGTNYTQPFGLDEVVFRDGEPEEITAHKKERIIKEIIV